MGENQGRCPDGTCSNKTLRESGCFICSKQHGDDEKCETCLEDHIVYDGRCVGCLSMEVCPFNNSDVVDCIDEHDLSHCVDEPDATNCSDHVCVNWNCLYGDFNTTKECEIGGMGCRGCVCMKGWYSNHSKDCFSKCGDGNVTSDEECEVGGDGCDGDSCKCKRGWRQGVSGSVSCSGICGDGVVVGREECDSGSGCGVDNCRCSVGWYPCSPLNESCHSFCGDGHVVGDSEECEIGGRGCDDSCRCLGGWYGNNQSVSCVSLCGDGIAVGSEECDMSVGCDNTTCKCSSGWSGHGDGRCSEVCGDGVVVGREECDSTPGCSDIRCECEQDHPYNNESGLCMYCGNGIVEGSEECDMNDEHCENRTCKCISGYSLSESVGMMICVKSGKKNDNNDMIVVFVVIPLIIIIIVVVIVVVMILKKKRTNDDESGGVGDGIEMDVYEVEMGGGKKGRLEISSTLYESGMTIVYKGIVDGKKDVVVKIMKMWGTKLDSGQAREMELMRRLKSEYIVEYYGTSVVEGRLGIVMEYMALGSLEGLMSKKVFSPELKIRYVREICYGMRYLHSENIIHRDLKLSNVLVVSDDVGYSDGVICKISDFGTSREVDIQSTLSMSQSMTMTNNIGTPLYMAPEILSGVGHYSQKADVYSYGILMVSLWNQKPPYSEMVNREARDLLSDITTRGLRPHIESECPQSYFNLASACLVEDPHSRPSFDEICKTVFDS